MGRNKSSLTAKVPIRITLKAPAWEVLVEINPQSPSHFHFRENTTGVAKPAKAGFVIYGLGF
jgi:hypothetical protein